MTPQKAKWVTALTMGVLPALADVAVQLQAAGSANLSRSALIGLALGGLVRAVGALVSLFVEPVR